MRAWFWLTAPGAVHTLPRHARKQEDRLQGPGISFERRNLMRLAVPAVIAGGCLLAMLTATGAAAQDIKIGTIYDLTGPFAGGGSKPAFIGNKIAIDMINEKGGVEGHKIVAIDADAQSKVDVAINEAERLLNEAKVDLLMGVYSSA